MNNKVVKASAGTGKTYRLSIEYINMLLKGREIDEIVVLTFTKKATAEIRDKIFINIDKLLERGSRESDMILESLKKIGNDSEVDEIFKIIKRKKDEMISRKEKIKITTIDSFINSIFSKIVAPAIHLYSYEIIDDDKNEEYILDCFEKLVGNQNEFLKIKKFLEKYIERNIENYTGWLKSIIENRWIFQILKNEPKMDNQIILNIKNDFDLFKNRFFENEAVIEALKNGKVVFKKGYDEIFGKSILELTDIEFKTILGDNFWQKRIFTKYKEEEALIISLFEDIKNKIGEYLICKKIIPFYNDVRDIEKLLSETYDKVKFNERKFTHSDISYYTFTYITKLAEEGKDILEENLLYEAIDTNIKSILIDEFQDTSIIQWKIVYPIVKTSIDSVCVGDEKQSIYSFRGGEKGLFENLNKIITGNVESLDTSYRSSSAVISFVNKFFETFNPTWEYRKVNFLENKSGGEVSLKSFDKNSEENAFLYIVNQILKNGEYNKCAILARKNDELDKFAETLLNAGIPFVKDGKKTIIEHRAVKPIYKLINFIVKEEFMELAEFLRSPLCNISILELDEVCKNRALIMEMIFEKENDFEFKSDRLNMIFQKLKILIKYDYSKFCEHIFSEFAVGNFYNDEQDLENIIKFITIMKSFSSKEQLITDISENEKSEKYKQEGINNNEGVNLMTIHKSKGLEFDTVYCYIKVGGKKSNNRIMKSYISYSDDFTFVKDLIFAMSDEEYLIKYGNKQLYEINKRKQFDDWVNNLYVVLTRAKNNMHIAIEFGKGVDKLDLSEEDLSYEYSYIVKAIENATQKSVEEIYNEHWYYSDNTDTNIIKEEFVIKEEKTILEFGDDKFLKGLIFSEKEEVNEYIKVEYKMQEFQKLGLAAHYYISFIKYNLESERKIALSNTMRKYGNMLGKEKLYEVINKVEKFIKKKKELFDANKEIITELSIYDNNEEKEYRIDRIILDKKNKTALIVDFKTGKTREQLQLNKYIKLVKEKLPDYIVDAKFENI